MILFAIDTTVEKAKSKANLLAHSVASAMRDARFWEPDINGVAICQCLDGKVCGKDTQNYNRSVAILHDWFPSYLSVCAKADALITIGDVNMPKLRKTPIAFDGFPVCKWRFNDLPKSQTDLLIGGSVRDGSDEFVMQHFPDGVKTVSMMCSPHRKVGNRAVIDRIVDWLRNERGCEVTCNMNAGQPLLETTYLTARCIMHLGDCRRGWLHSISEYAKRRNGVEVICERPYGDAKIVDIDEFCEELCEKII